MQTNLDFNENESIESATEDSEDDKLFEIQEVSFDDSSIPGLVSVDPEPADSPAASEGFQDDSDTDKIDSDMLEIDNDLTLYRDDIVP